MASFVSRTAGLLRRKLVNPEQSRSLVSTHDLQVERRLGGGGQGQGLYSRRSRKPVSISQDDASTRITKESIRPNFGPLSSSILGVGGGGMFGGGARSEFAAKEYPDTPEGRWKARSETDKSSFTSMLATTPQPNTPYTSRVCTVNSGRTLEKAFAMMSRKLNNDNIRGETIEKKYYVQPSSGRSRLRSKLHRRRFAAEIGSRIHRVMDLQRKGF